MNTHIPDGTPQAAVLSPYVDVWIESRKIGRLLHPDLRDAEGAVLVRGKARPGSDAILPLSAEDCATVASLLPRLPRLHGRMSTEEIQAFRSAWQAIPDAPLWTPILPTEQEVWWESCGSYEVVNRIRSAVGVASEAGLVDPVDHHGSRCAAQDINARVPAQVLALISAGAGLPFEAQADRQGQQKVVPKPDGQTVLWGMEEAEAIVAHRVDHTWPQTIAKFGRSRRFLMKVVKNNGLSLPTPKRGPKPTYK